MLINNISELKQYTPAKLTKGKEWYISYYAYNPELKKLQRKKIKVNHVKTNRLKYANELIKRINNNLQNGWNPFINPETNKNYKKISDAINHFLTIADRKTKDDLLRSNTNVKYISYLKIFNKWIKKTCETDIYVYKLDKYLCNKFLDYIYIDKKRSARTRNNYLNNLRIFAEFLCEYDYLKFKFTDGVKTLKNREKQRIVIEDKDLNKLNEYLIKKDLFFLFACKFIYSTFIRPREMSFLQLKHIDLKNGIIEIDKKFSKNRKTQCVTINDDLGRLMIDLGLFSYDPETYIFSKGCKPGAIQTSSKQFRDKWLKTRTELKFTKQYQFYSLKDTGITHLLEQTNDLLLVRDQARHSSIEITNKYLRRFSNKANENIKKIILDF